jgi:hypothetical protein
MAPIAASAENLLWSGGQLLFHIKSEVISRASSDEERTFGVKINLSKTTDVNSTRDRRRRSYVL